MGSPVYLRFADGSARCVDCKGFGLVRALGPRAGTHYKTLAGAQDAFGKGHAKDCPVCEGCGLVNLPGTREFIQSFGVDREAVREEKVQCGVRSALMSEAGYTGSDLVRARTPAVYSDEAPVF